MHGALASAGVDRLRPVRAWLWAVAALLVLMVLVGGATRLTDSGLSIVEWRPVTGALPPLSESAWMAEFAKYRDSPEYREVNAGMSLDAFKRIYWWEWGHRLLGRLIGAVFLLPFLFFLWKGMVPAHLRRRLWLIFGLGAMQGAVGWWMVASGLVGRVDVAPERLATHLTLALVIFCAVLWTLRDLQPARPRAAAPMRLSRTAIVLLVLVFVQTALGALVAGLKAGLVHDTWPLIDGAFVPAAEALFAISPWWANFLDNPLTVQFVHRLGAYVLLALALAHAWDTSRTAIFARAGALGLLLAVLVQATLGVATLVLHVPMALALAHQAGAILVIGVATVHAHALHTRRAVIVAAPGAAAASPA
jgi:cytochrome c oxidase assembly protein subunit 15